MVIDSLDDGRYKSLGVIVDRVVRTVLTSIKPEDVTFRLTEWVSVHSLLRKLCFDGKADQGKGLVWRLM